MCAAMFIGVNSETFFTTGALVTCIKNFPDRRGLNSTISGGILAQFLAAFCRDDDAHNLLLTLAWLASAVALAFLLIFWVLEKEKQIKETSEFYKFLYVSIALALFLMAVTIQFPVQFTRAAYIARAVVIVVLLLPSLYIAIRAELTKQVLQSLAKGVSAEARSYRFTWKSVHSKNDKKRSKLSSCFGSVFDKPRRGEDYAILQAPLSTDMLILTGSAIFGMGAIFAAIDNMGQMCFDHCGGKMCLRTSFLVVAGGAFFGALLSFVLAMRTEEFYRVDIVRIYKGEFYQKFEEKNNGELDHVEKGVDSAEQRVQRRILMMNMNEKKPEKRRW